MLNKDLILKKADLKTEVINIPEWEGDITIRELSGASLEKWQSKAQKPNADSAVTLGEMIAISVVNQDGSPMFKMSDLGDLLGKSHRPLMRIYNAAIKLNRLANEDVGELEKN